MANIRCRERCLEIGGLAIRTCSLADLHANMISSTRVRTRAEEPTSTSKPSVIYGSLLRLCLLRITLKTSITGAVRGWLPAPSLLFNMHFPLCDHVLFFRSCPQDTRYILETPARPVYDLNDPCLEANYHIHDSPAVKPRETSVYLYYPQVR